MITIDKKSKMAIDIALHIPIPSFRIQVVTDKDTIAENTELTYNRKAEQVLEAKEQEKEAAQPKVQAAELDSAKKDAGS